MYRIFALLTLISAAAWASANTNPIVVDCGMGQSLNRTLAKMDKYTQATVLIKGTCTEYVRMDGFDGLMLKGLPGATLNQPSSGPSDNLSIVLLIEASRRITVSGLAVHSGSSAVAGIGVAGNSQAVRLHNLKVDGVAAFGIQVYENSQVLLQGVTGHDTGYAAVGIFGGADVAITDCLFEQSTGALWHVGLHVGGSGHVAMRATTIRNMQAGVFISDSGSVEITDFNSPYPYGANPDVIVENPAGTNYWGVSIGSGGSLGLGGSPANLRITNSGQAWGYNTAGVYVSDGGTLNAVATNGGKLFVSGSQGHGVFVSNNSHASLSDSSITGSGHGGLVVVNQSTIAVGFTNSLTQLSGNGTDLFCDSKSLITGGANIASPTSVQCANLLQGDYENLP